MPEEHSFDLRIAHSSPLFTATPLTGNRTTGWATLCTAGGFPCDAPGQSAVYTTVTGATMDLQFWGSRIEVRGNLTGGMELEWQLDGVSQTLSSQQTSKESSNVVGEPLDSSLLAVFEGLDSAKAHKLRITTKPSLPSGVVAFEGVVVTVGTGVTGGTMSMTYLDDSDSRLVYSQTPGGWAEYHEYESSAFNITHPNGVTNLSFHSTKMPRESVSMNFNGTQVLLYGPCYSSNGAYTITLDQQDTVVYNASTNAYSAPPVASVAGACLHYVSPPLSPDKLHYISMANNDDGRETNLDWVLIVGNSGGMSISDAQKGKGSNVAAIAGAVAGSVALLLALAALWWVLRCHKVKRVSVRGSSQNSSGKQNVKAVDLLSSSSDIPKLLDGERQPSILTNPSHGGQSNTRSYQRIEPFELPPLVDDAGDEKTRLRNESTPSSVSSTRQAPPTADPNTRTSVASAPTAATTPSGLSETGIVSISRAPALESQVHEPSTQPVAHPAQVEPPPPAASDQAEAQPAYGARSHQTQPSQSSSDATPNLSQISSDVNRILAQLGQIRRKGRRGYSGGAFSAEEEDIPEGAPPEYGKHRRA